MDHAELRAAVLDYFRAQLKAGKDRVSSSGPFSVEQIESTKVLLAILEDGNREYWTTLGSDFARAELDQFFKATGLPRERYKDHVPVILNEIRKARIGAYKAILEYSEGLETYDFREAVSGPLRASVQQSVPTPYPTIPEAVEAFFRVHEKSSDWTPGTVEKRRAMLSIAVEWFGPDRSMADISKRDAAALKEALLSLPANRFKVAKLRGLSLREMIAAEGLPRISNATVNAHLSAYRIFWDWAEKHDYAPEALFHGMSLNAKSGGSKDRKSFTQEALSKAYSALTDPGGKFHQKTSHRWATLIAMFSGARLNEVCQLQVKDIRQMDGVWMLDFNDEGDEDKRLKSAAAKRRVPMHSRLLELGLLELRDQRSADGHERLFPDYTFHPKHGYGGSLSKWFNRTFTMALGIKSDAHVFHGLRHTFATRLLQADVPTEMVQFIIGHEREGVTHQVYAKEGYALDQTKKAVECFTVSARTSPA